MPFLILPFVTKLQTKIDQTSPVFDGFTEGDTEEPTMISDQLTEPPAPLPPFDWATVWADAFMMGAVGLIPANSMHAAGRTAMFGILMTSKSATPKHMILKAACYAYAITIIPGFLPAATAFPPQAPGPMFDLIDDMGMNSTTNLPWLLAAGNIINQWFLEANMLYLPTGPMMKWL